MSFPLGLVGRLQRKRVYSLSFKEMVLVRLYLVVGQDIAVWVSCDFSVLSIRRGQNNSFHGRSLLRVVKSLHDPELLPHLWKERRVFHDQSKAGLFDPSLTRVEPKWFLYETWVYLFFFFLQISPLTPNPKGKGSAPSGRRLFISVFPCQVPSRSAIMFVECTR